MPSQRPSTGSSGPSRRRQASSESEDSDAGDTSAQTGSQSAGAGGGRGGLTLKQIQHCAAQLVRLALFHEYQRKVLRRDIIIQKVIPPNAKGAFNVVLHRAQTVLRQKFGMELYELRMKSKGAGAAGMEGTQAYTQAQTQAQTQRKKGRTSRLDAIAEEEEDEDEEEEEEAVTQAAKQPGSKTYIVRSILSPEIREMMAAPRALNIPNDETSRDDDDYVDSGALIPLDKADGTTSGSIQLLGVRTVILSLIMCMGRVIADDHLHSLLKRLNLYRDTVLPYTSPDGKDLTITLDKYMDLLHRQQYIEKVKIVSQLGPGDVAAAFEWRWGNREAEFSEKAVQEWMTRLLAGADDDEDEDEDEHPRDRRGVERRRKRQEERASKVNHIRQDIVKAAGGPLTGDL